MEALLLALVLWAGIIVIFVFGSRLLRAEKDVEELRTATRDFRTALAAALVPPIERLLVWLDRQLRRWPRLYAWLSR